MDPVMRALQSIADIESETRELDQLEPASACRTTRFEPTTTYATSGGTADLNGDLSALETNGSEASGAWDEEIKIDRCDRIVITPTRDVTRHAVTLIGALLPALAFCVVWLGGLDSHFTVESALLPEKTVKSSADRPDSAKPGQPSASSADAIAGPNGSVQGISKRDLQRIEPWLTKQAANAPQRTAVARTDLSKPTAVAETRPTTIAGWVIREVNGSTAVLEGPNGVWRASQGDTVPSIGKIDSIVRWGNRWIVATSKGLISTR